MAIDARPRAPLTDESLLRFRFPERVFEYGVRDTILYALGVGAGVDGPEDERLGLVFEDDLKALPSQATVIAWADDWIDALSLNQPLIVHGEQRVSLPAPLPVAGRVRSTTRIREVVDKGPARGLLLYVETLLSDAETGAPVAELLSTVFARGDGGIGGPAQGGPAPHRLPDRPADQVVVQAIAANQALIYRMSGDLNPLHISPPFARAAGFPRPILHGLCTYGFAVRAITEAVCNHDPSPIRSIAARFAQPVYPGDSLRTEIWVDGPQVSFRAATEAGVVLDHGLVTLSDRA